MLQIDLKGKTVLITGVLSGIGAGIAKSFAIAGANVSGCDLSEDDNGFTKDMKDSGVQALYTKSDVTNEGELRRFVTESVIKFGEIHILVSNAGQNFFEGALNCNNENWNQNIDLNLKSHWQLS